MICVSRYVRSVDRNTEPPFRAATNDQIKPLGKERFQKTFEDPVLRPFRRGKVKYFAIFTPTDPRILVFIAHLFDVPQQGQHAVRESRIPDALEDLFGSHRKLAIVVVVLRMDDTGYFVGRRQRQQRRCERSHAPRGWSRRL
eukprot:scaffold22432_cov168-Amphora_coffeaeformis.AAC.20